MGLRDKNTTEFDVARSKRFENNELIFSNDLILPNEQLEGLVKVYNANVKTKKFQSTITKEEYEAKMKKILIEIVSKLHDKRLGDNPGKITLVHSTGGTNKNSEHLFREPNTPFVMIDVNGVFILEAIGEENNASFIGKKTDNFIDNLKKMGRTEIQKKGVAEKIIHDPSSNGYNFESGHVLELIDYALDYNQQLIEVIKGIHSSGKKFCSLKTLKGYLASVISDDLISKSGITERDALDAIDSLESKSIEDDREI